MSGAIRESAQQLRRLVEDYYRRQMTFEEYRAQRKLILDQLEAGSSARTETGDQREAAELDPSTTVS